MCRTLFHFLVSFLIKTAVSSVHVTAAIFIRRSVFCTLRATSRFHLICHRIQSLRQRCHHHLHHQTSLPEYPRHPLHYGSEDPLGRPDTNSTLVAWISQKQTAKYSRTNVIRNTKPTEQGSKNYHWQLRRSTSARLSHIIRNKSSYVYKRYTATNGGIIVAFMKVALNNDPKNFRLYLYITFLHIKYVGSNLLRSTPPWDAWVLISNKSLSFFFPPQQT